MLILGAFIFSAGNNFLEETLLEIKKKTGACVLSAPYFSKFFGGKNKIY